jgi:hypothetical protein
MRFCLCSHHVDVPVVVAARQRALARRELDDRGRDRDEV